MVRDLRVGIIGASATRGWAKMSHIPAVQGLAGLTLGAVVGSNQRSADAAAAAFGVARAYGSAADLFEDRSIDVVVIAVKVPEHRSLVLAAIAAGKHLYCEWPLGRDVQEAEELAAAARSAGVHAAIGLQTRLNPAGRHARKLIASGAIGRVLSARIVSTTMAFGRKVDAEMAFAEDAANGVTLATIQGGHTIDFALATLGPLHDAGMLASTQFPQVELGEDACKQARSTPDHLLLQGRLASGSPLSIEVAGGRPPDAVPFTFEVVGETATLVLEGGAPRGFQSGRLRLRLDGQEQPVDEGELAGFDDPAVNVAAIYANLRDDVRNGVYTVPDFDHATGLSRLIGDMAASSRDGTRKPARHWPGES